MRPRADQPPRRRADALCIGVLALAATLYVLPGLLPGRVMLPADLLLLMQPWKHQAWRFPEFREVHNPFLDAIQQAYPWRAFAHEQMSGGEIPLWNDRECGGTPLVANNQSGVFFPNSILFYVLPADRAFAFHGALTLWQGGLFMFLFIRTLGARPAAALCGAMAFQFHGVAVVWLMMPGWAATCLWAPAPLWCLERALRDARWPWAVACAVAFGIQLTAGQLQFAAYSALALFAYGAFRLIQTAKQRDWRRLRVGAGALGLTALLGPGLAALQILPVMEIVPLCARPALAWDDVASRCFHLRQAFALLTPGFFGSDIDRNYWGDVGIGAGLNYIETCAYVGVPTLILAGLAIAWRRRPATWFFAGLAAAGLLLAFRTGAGWLLFQLPFASRLSGVGRVIFLFCLAMPVLAGLGAEELARRWQTEQAAVRKAAFTAAGAGAAALLAMALYLWIVGPALEKALPGFYAYEGRQVGRFAGWAAGTIALLLVGLRAGPRVALPLLAGLVMADMFVFGARFNAGAPRAILHLESRVVARMRADRALGHMVSLGSRDARGFLNRMPPNLPIAYGLSDIQGSDSLRTGRWLRLLQNMEPPRTEGVREPDPASPLLDMVATRYVYTPRVLSASGLELVDAAEGNLYLNHEARPHAWCVRSARPVNSPAEARAAVLDPSFDPAREVVVFPAPSGPRTAGDDCRQPDRVVERGPNRRTVEGDFGPGWLVLADAYYPDWRATVDGEAADVFEADWVLRAVRLPRRARRVEFVYWPTSFAAGQFITLVSALALAALVTATRRR